MMLPWQAVEELSAAQQVAITELGKLVTELRDAFERDRKDKWAAIEALQKAFDAHKVSVDQTTLSKIVVRLDAFDMWKADIMTTLTTTSPAGRPRLTQTGKSLRERMAQRAGRF